MTRQRLTLLVEKDELGKELLRDQVLELFKALLAQVVGEVLGARPKEDPCAGQQNEET